jgi:hypothetical protein
MLAIDWKTLHEEVWQPCRDLYEEMATLEMKRRNLIQRPSEPEDAYGNRVKAAYLDNHYGSALRSYAALLGKFSFTNEPAEPPKTITESNKATPEGRTASNIDLNGNDFKSILSSINQMALCLGAVMVVVDVYEPEKKKEGVEKRPFIRIWDLDEIYYKNGNDRFDRGIVTIVEGGATFIESFCGRYEVAELNDEGSLETVEYYLEYKHRPARTILWKMEDGSATQVGKEAQIKGANGKQLDELPVIWHDFNGNPPGEPPLPLLFSLARLNITHFNALSEFQTILTVVNGPTPVRTWAPGVPVPEERQDLFLGINSVLDMPGGSTVSFLEPSGNALSISAQVLTGQLEQMQRLGQRFLSGGDVARTATEAMLDSAQAETLLLDMANRVENTAEEIIKWWRVFEDPGYSYPDYAGGITINTEALLVPMQPQEIQSVMQLFLNGLIDAATALKIMHRNGAIKDEDLSEQVKKLMDGEMPAQVPGQEGEEPKEQGQKPTEAPEPEEPEEEEEEEEEENEMENEQEEPED